LLREYYNNILLSGRSDNKWENYNIVYKRLPYPLFERLKEVSKETDMSTFFKDYGCLAGFGFIDDAQNNKKSTKNYQYYTIQLNLSDKEKVDFGTYILAILDKKQAFEIFLIKDEIHFYCHSNYDEAILKSILLKFCDEEDIERIKKYANAV
jgi:hypothetical protein